MNIVHNPHELGVMFAQEPPWNQLCTCNRAKERINKGKSASSLLICRSLVYQSKCPSNAMLGFYKWRKCIARQQLKSFFFLNSSWQTQTKLSYFPLIPMEGEYLLRKLNMQLEIPLLISKYNTNSVSILNFRMVGCWRFTSLLICIAVIQAKAELPPLATWLPK